MRAWPLLAFVAMTGAAAFALWSAGCLGDLPAATAADAGDAAFDGLDAGDTSSPICPPPPQNEAGDCVRALATEEGGACPNSASMLPVMQCLAGPRTNCACGSGECTGGAPVCFQGTCPPAVLQMQPNATCLTPSQFIYPSSGVPEEMNCYCSCPTCALACDGIGAIVATGTTTGSNDASFAGVEFVLIDAGLPYAGKLGFYIRLRGKADTVYFATFDSRTRVFYPVVAGDIPSDGQFHEFVKFIGYVTDGGPGPDSWGDPSHAPLAIVVAPQQGEILEVDCLIPFTLPP
jgi:hypothetical protein